MKTAILPSLHVLTAIPNAVIISDLAAAGARSGRSNSGQRPTGSWCMSSRTARKKAHAALALTLAFGAAFSGMSAGCPSNAADVTVREVTQALFNAKHDDKVDYSGRATG